MPADVSADVKLQIKKNFFNWVRMRQTRKLTIAVKRFGARREERGCKWEDPKKTYSRTE